MMRYTLTIAVLGLATLTAHLPAQPPTTGPTAGTAGTSLEVDLREVCGIRFTLPANWAQTATAADVATAMAGDPGVADRGSRRFNGLYRAYSGSGAWLSIASMNVKPTGGADAGRGTVDEESTARSSSRSLEASIRWPYVSSTFWQMGLNPRRSEADFLLEMVGADFSNVHASWQLGADHAGKLGMVGQLRYFSMQSDADPVIYVTFYFPPSYLGAQEGQELLTTLKVHREDVGVTYTHREMWLEYMGAHEGAGAGQGVATQIQASTGMAPGSAVTVGAPASSEGGMSMGDLVQQHQSSLLIFKGRNGAGSGFIANGGGADLIFSNIHVVAAEQNMEVRTVTGAKVKVGAAEAAVDHDIIRFRPAEEVPNATRLMIMKDVTAEAKVGDPVAVLGNSEGAGVVTALRGTILGIGPDRVEINARFIPGNSGSPVIHVPTGKVIGVATYLMLHDATFDGEGPVDDDPSARSPRSIGSSSERSTRKFRRFAYRLDSVQEWQPIAWPVFYRQSEELRRSEAMTERIYALLSDLANDGSIDSYAHTDSTLRPYVLDFQRVAGARERVNSDDAKAAVGRLLSGLRSACKTEIGPSTPNGYYDYFWDGFQEQRSARSQLTDRFDTVLRGLYR